MENPHSVMENCPHCDAIGPQCDAIMPHCDAIRPHCDAIMPTVCRLWSHSVTTLLLICSARASQSAHYLVE